MSVEFAKEIKANSISSFGGERDPMFAECCVFTGSIHCCTYAECNSNIDLRFTALLPGRSPSHATNALMDWRPKLYCSLATGECAAQSKHQLRFNGANFFFAYVKATFMSHMFEFIPRVYPDSETETSVFREKDDTKRKRILSPRLVQYLPAFQRSQSTVSFLYYVAG